MAKEIGPRELQLRQLALMTRAGKNERSPKPALIDALKGSVGKTSEAMVKSKGKSPKKKARRRT